MSSRRAIGASIASVVLAVATTACSVGRPADDATGAEIYAQLCANCHGADLDGRGIGPPLGPDSSAASEPDEFLEFTVTNGRGRMPSFASSLDEGQLSLLVAYIREVQGR